VNREEEPMAEDTGPREAATVGRQPPESEPRASASEERAGAEGSNQEAAPPEEPVPPPDDPPQGRPSEEQ